MTLIYLRAVSSRRTGRVGSGGRRRRTASPGSQGPPTARRASRTRVGSVRTPTWPPRHPETRRAMSTIVHLASHKHHTAPDGRSTEKQPCQHQQQSHVITCMKDQIFFIIEECYNVHAL